MQNKDETKKKRAIYYKAYRRKNKDKINEKARLRYHKNTYKTFEYNQEEIDNLPFPQFDCPNCSQNIKLDFHPNEEPPKWLKYSCPECKTIMSKLTNIFCKNKLCNEYFKPKSHRNVYCSRKCFKKSWYYRPKEVKIESFPTFSCPSCKQNITLNFHPTKDIKKWKEFACPECKHKQFNN